MRAIKPNMRHRSLWRTVLLALVAIVIGGAGTVGALVALKVIDPAQLAFWRTKEKKERVIPKGWIAVPVCARPIPAYEMVTLDYLVDPKTHSWAVSYKPPNEVPKEVILELSKIRGRVMARLKPAAGYAFTEDDFLPPGTRPGVAGGTPLGKWAYTLDASKLKGEVHDLKAGDHVKLLVCTSVDTPGTGKSGSGRMGTNLVMSPTLALPPKRGLSWLVVHDGVVVLPVKIRNIPTTASTLTQGRVTRSIPVEEIVIAVDPAEVAPLDQAIDLKYEIHCLAVSGRPGAFSAPAAQPAAGGLSGALVSFAKALLKADGAAPNKAASQRGKAKNVNGPKSETPAKDPAASDVLPGLDPMANMTYMEVMIGGQRQFMLFTGPGNSPVVAGQDDGSAKAGGGEEGKP